MDTMDTRRENSPRFFLEKGVQYLAGQSGTFSIPWSIFQADISGILCPLLENTFFSNLRCTIYNLYMQQFVSDNESA